MRTVNATHTHTYAHCKRKTKRTMENTNANAGWPKCTRTQLLPACCLSAAARSLEPNVYRWQSAQRSGMIDFVRNGVFVCKRLQPNKTKELRRPPHSLGANQQQQRGRPRPRERESKRARTHRHEAPPTRIIRCVGYADYFTLSSSSSSSTTHTHTHTRVRRL